MHLIMLVNHIYTSRVVNVTGASIIKPVKYGTSQVGVISQLLWLLVVDGILKRLEAEGITVKRLI